MLFDEQGLGKTITAIAAADAIGVGSILVVAPAVVVYNWAKELRVWSPTRLGQVIGSGGDTISSDVSVVIVSHTLFHSPRIFAQLLAEQWDLLIVDELHNFRNCEAQRTRALYGSPSNSVATTELFGAAEPTGDCLTKACDRVWGLTGTPIPNHVAELWTHLRGLFPETIPNEIKRPMSFSMFRSRYCKTRPTRYGIKVVGNKNLAELKARTGGVMLRRLKKDVLDLPSIRFETVSLQPTKLPWEFKQLTGEIRALLDDAGNPTASEGFAALRASSDYARFRRWCGLAKVDSTVEMLKAELEFGGLDKVVVFAHHTDVVEGIATGLFEFSPLTITGAVPPAERTARVDAFQNRDAHRVMVCNIVAGGVGVTLTAASDVVFAELSFVPGENAQAADRCHRIGQTERVRVRCLALAGSIDEDIVGILTTKTRMIREALS